MQKRTFFKRLFVGLLLAIIVCMGVVIYQLQANLHAVQTALGNNQRISVLEQAVGDNYYESVDDSKLMDGALGSRLAMRWWGLWKRLERQLPR